MTRPHVTSDTDGRHGRNRTPLGTVATRLPNPDRTNETRSTAMQGFFDAGGGTRTPDTRIMIGALALVFGGAAAAFVGLGGVRTGQICRVGDTVRDTAWRRRRGRARLGHAAGEAPGAERAALSAKPSDRADAGCSRPGVLRHHDRDGG